MTVLRAKIQRVTGYTRHVAVTQHGRVELAPASILRITPAEGAFFLLRFTSDGAPLTDTWHASVDEAKKQALVEYEVPLDAWQEEAN